jgi:hypothetical protein
MRRHLSKTFTLGVIWGVEGTGLLVLLIDSMRHSGHKDILGIICLPATANAFVALLVCTIVALSTKRVLTWVDAARILLWTAAAFGLGILWSRGYIGYFWPSYEGTVEVVGRSVLLGSVVLITLLSIVARTPRVEREGHCPNCGYNLQGLESGRCPECSLWLDE